MRGRTAGALTAGGVAAVLAGAGWVAYAMTGEESASPRGTAAPTKADTRADGVSKAVIKLPDGRKVEIRYVDGKGLGERHFSPDAGKWSATKLIHRTKADPCQGVELAATDGTVAAVADFGQYCHDGEPPQESVAAVGTGEFTEWRTDVREDFDGWDKANVGAGGASAAFVFHTEETVETLKWSEEGGFSGPEEKARPGRKLSEKFFGSWKTEDGSQRLAVQKRGNGGVATFFSRKGERCVTRVGLHPNRTNVGEFTAVFREMGDRSGSCPAYEDLDFMSLNKAGTALSFQRTDATFTRAEPNAEERALPSPPRPVDTVDKDWLGEWRLEDGSGKVTVSEPKPGEPTAVFTGKDGGCVARAELFSQGVEKLFNIASKPPELVKGEEGTGCPPKNVDFTLSGDGKSFTQKAEGGPELTYVRSAAPAR